LPPRSWRRTPPGGSSGSPPNSSRCPPKCKPWGSIPCKFR
jgi:hypothetical protein